MAKPNRAEAANYSSRVSYASKHSHTTRKAAIDHGYSDDDAKLLASIAYARAGAFWVSIGFDDK
jgi:hypothetical protein